MSDNLETKLRDLARAGEISHISLTPSQGGKAFRAAFAMCSRFGFSFAEDPDPVKAIMIALTTAKTKKPPPRPASFDLKATREEDHTGVKEIDPAGPTKEGLIMAAEAVEASHDEPDKDPLADLM